MRVLVYIIMLRLGYDEVSVSSRNKVVISIILMQQRVMINQH